MKDLVHDFHRAARVVNPEYKDTGVTADSTLTGAFIRVIKNMLHDDPKKEMRKSKGLSLESFQCSHSDEASFTWTLSL